MRLEHSIRQIMTEGMNPVTPGPITEGMFGSLIKKVLTSAAAYSSPKELADAWYSGTEKELKKMKSELTHDNVEKYGAAIIAISQTRDHIASMKSGKEAMEFMADINGAGELIKKKTEEILKKGLFKEEIELHEAASLNDLRKTYLGAYLSALDLEEYPSTFQKAANEFAKKYKLKPTEVAVVHDEGIGHLKFKQLISKLEKGKIPHVIWDDSLNLGEGACFFSLKEGLSESAKPFEDPIKGSKGLHNSQKPLGQATMKELEASKKWFQDVITNRADAPQGLSNTCKKLLSLVNTELASRIGKKNESVELDEGFYYSAKTPSVKKIEAALAIMKADEIVDFWRTVSAHYEMNSGSKDGSMADLMMPHLKKILSLIIYNAKHGELDSAKDSVKEEAELNEGASFMRLPGHVIGNELWQANKALDSFTSSQLKGNDFNAKNFDQILSTLTTVRKEAKTFTDPESVPVSYQYKDKK